MYLGVHISRRLSHFESSSSSPSFINQQIKTLVQQGRHIQAFQLYSKNHLVVTTLTYPSILKACASVSNLEYGRTIHSTIITKGLSLDPFTTSSLISMYIKCGSLGNAVQVFDKCPESGVSRLDVTIWNSIIAGYFRFGRVREGVTLFRQMLLLGVRPDAYSLCNHLHVCNGPLGCLEGKQIHGYALRNFFGNDPFLEIALIDMYLSGGRSMDAWRFFQGLEDKSNVVAWNVLIRGFGEVGMWERSLELYSLAKQHNVQFLSASFTSTLSTCCQGEFLSFGEQVHCEVIKKGFEDDPYVCTTLLTMYAKCKLVDDAEKLFEHVSEKEIELWNAMISAYVGNKHPYDALKAYKHMKWCKIPPDLFTMSTLLSASSMVGSYDFGRSIHTELVKRNIQNDGALQSALLTMYSNCQSNYEAYLVFNSIKERDVVAWGSMISAFCHNKKYNEAFNLFREMKAQGVKPDSDIMASVLSACTKLDSIHLGCLIHGIVIKNGSKPDVFVACSLLDMYSKLGFLDMAENVFSDMPLRNLVAWNSIMSCYCRNGLPEMSINLFSQLLCHGLYPDSVSITTVLTAISSTAALHKGKTVHGWVTRLNIPCDLQVQTTLIDMYVKCGFLKYAQSIFQNMPLKNLVTWNSMIAGYGSHGECLKALSLFDEMTSSGISPDDITFLSLLSSCSHSGYIKEGLNLFQLMITNYDIEPRMEHYNSVVDLFGRAGRLDDAFSLVKNMVIKPGRSIWLSLLCACRAYRNVELGELAAHELLKIEPGRVSNYLQLIDLYREEELWDRVANLRFSMKEIGLKKSPGCSWIEVGNNVNVFLSGDCSRTTGIFETLNSLRWIMTKKEENCESLESLADW